MEIIHHLLILPLPTHTIHYRVIHVPGEVALMIHMTMTADTVATTVITPVVWIL